MAIPQVKYPLGVAAKSVVYVCDSSGSMLGHFDEVRAEIVKGVARLTEGQSFNVVFMRETGSSAMSVEGLLPATGDNATKCSKFVESISARGTTNPIPAMELACGNGRRLLCC